MSAHITRSTVTHRRAELMAELFLQEFEPKFVSRPTAEDVGYDLIAGFPNDKGGINVLAVEVKATERPPRGRFPIMRHTFERLAHSNIPSLLLVADVKQNQLYFAWLNAGKMAGSAIVSIPLIAVNEGTKAELRRQLHAANGDVSAAG